MVQSVIMPKLGQATEESTIVKWHKHEGDTVKKGDILFEMETDKAVLEAESFFDGTLLKVIVGENVTVPVNVVVAYIGAPGEKIPDAPPSQPVAPKTDAQPAKASASSAKVEQPVVRQAVAETATVVPSRPVPQPAAPAKPGRLFISPRAKALVESKVIDPSAIRGSGPNGRIVERDVAKYLESAGYDKIGISPTAKKLAAKEKLDILRIKGTGEGGRIMVSDVELALKERPVKMSKMRQVIARRLTDSFTTTPHFYVTVSADMTDLLAFRKELKDKGEVYSVTDFILEAVILSLKEIPAVNSMTSDGAAVRWRGTVELGMAVALDEGLVVPVIKSAENLSMKELHEIAQSLAAKARAGKLLPDEMTGSSFTVSNMGMLDVESFGAIINPGEGAIIAVASTKDTPVVVKGEIKIRAMMKMTLSVDHRIIDGSTAAAFVNAVKTKLEGHSTMEKFDVVVIGAGPGGYPAAIRAAQLGAKVAIVEKEAVGGTCLNWGCIPTKSLIASSSLYSAMAHAEKMGLGAKGTSFDYPAMIKRKDEVVAKLKGGVAMLLKGNGVKTYAGTASFVSRNRIAIAGDSEETIEAGATIIATGSTSSMPGFLPKSDRVVDSRKFLEMTKLPASLIVLGGGVIGCEFACMAAQLGAKVTIVEMLEDVLMILDADVRAELRSHMEKGLGITILTGKPLDNITADKKTVHGTVDGKKVEAEVLLVSIGRRPVTADLGLDKIGIETNKGGYIEVDEYCRTKAATVFAIGDVTGGPQLAHAATSQGMTAAWNAISKKLRKIETLVPACIFTVPEIGCVGLSEQQAKDRGISYVVGKFSLANLGKALASGHSEGFVKWIVESGTDRLLGASAIGANATDLISEAALAIQSELTVAEVGNTIHCHPTMSESWMEAAHAVHGECIHAARRKAGGGKGVKKAGREYQGLIV